MKLILSMLIFSSFSAFAIDEDCRVLEGLLLKQVDAKLDLIKVRVDRDKEKLLASEFVQRNLTNLLSDGTPISWIGAGAEVNGDYRTHLNIYLHGFGASDDTLNAFSSGEKTWNEDISPDVLDLKKFLLDNKRKDAVNFTIELVSFQQDLHKTKALSLQEIDIRFEGGGRNFMSSKEMVDELLLPKKCQSQVNVSGINDSGREFSDDQDSSSHDSQSSSKVSNQ